MTTSDAGASPVDQPVVQPAPERCECHACIAEHDLRGPGGWPLAMTMMVLCPTCGNKRCPHATKPQRAALAKLGRLHTALHTEAPKKLASS